MNQGQNAPRAPTCAVCKEPMHAVQVLTFNLMEWMDAVERGAARGSAPKAEEIEFRCSNPVCQEVKSADVLILRMFEQACSDHSDEHGVTFYDHRYLSAYEHAQAYLIERGLIEEKRCLRGTPRDL